MSNSYKDVMARRNEIMRSALGLDYDEFNISPIAFDYEAMMAATGYSLDDVAEIQRSTKVGRTPLHELHRLTEAVRAIAGPGKGARILVKDEAANASGSFKARRASLSAHEARKKGFKGMVTATSGNYGAAVASQAAQQGLKCIVIQEVYDSEHVGQPEIVEKSRACEAYGAEVVKLTVGPELFYVLLRTLEETGYFNASLYTPYGIAGVETLGAEIGREVEERYGRQPDVVAVTHAGGGNLTGGPRPAQGGLRPDPGGGGLRRPHRPAHGIRQGLQQQVLHHGAHRFRGAVRHLARPGGRAAQRGPRPAVHERLPPGHPGRGLLHDRAADET